jgi:hypothetical protein
MKLFFIFNFEDLNELWRTCGRSVSRADFWALASIVAAEEAVHRGESW